MAKDLATYRVDSELRRAVADEAASRGETVTGVIIRAFREYVAENEPPSPGMALTAGQVRAIVQAVADRLR